MVRIEFVRHVLPFALVAGILLIGLAWLATDSRYSLDLGIKANEGAFTLRMEPAK